MSPIDQSCISREPAIAASRQTANVPSLMSLISENTQQFRHGTRYSRLLNVIGLLIESLARSSFDMLSMTSLAILLVRPRHTIELRSSPRRKLLDRARSENWITDWRSRMLISFEYREIFRERGEISKRKLVLIRRDRRISPGNRLT